MIFNVGAGGVSKAEQLEYDNSISGLNAVNVQGAVDELGLSLLKTIKITSASDLATGLTTAIENNVAANSGTFNFFLTVNSAGYCVQGYATPTHASGIMTQQGVANGWQFFHQFGTNATTLKDTTTVDSALSSTSDNPVQNKAITKALKTTYVTSSVSLQNWIATNINANSVPNDGMYHYFNNDTTEGSYFVKAIRIGNFLCGEVTPVTAGKNCYYFSKTINGTTTLTQLTPYYVYGTPTITFCGITFKFKRELGTVVVSASGQLTESPARTTWHGVGSIAASTNYLPSETKYMYFFGLDMKPMLMSVAPDGSIGIFAREQLTVGEYVVATNLYTV